MTINGSHTNALASCHANSTNGNSFHKKLSLPPEVLHMIMVNLPPKSLVKCALASREFNRMATPLVWSFHSDPQTNTKILGPEYRWSLVKNAHHIQFFTIRSEDTLSFFCPGVSKTEVESSQQPSLPIELPHLQELELAVPFRRCVPRSRPNYPQILTWVETSLSSLQILHIWNVIPPELAIAIAHTQQLCLTDILLRTEFGVAETTFFLSKLPSHVQSLKLEIISAHRLPKTYDDKSPFATNHHALRTLHLNGSCYSNTFERCLIPFLATCSLNLKSFQADNFNPLTDVNVQVALAKLGIQVETFTQANLENAQAEDEEIDNKVRVFTRLEMAILSNFKDVGPRTILTILALTETLRALELPNYGSISSIDVVAMLSSLKCLESFTLRGPLSVRASPFSRGDHDAPPCTIFLNAADIFSIEWATKSLKSFTCPIRVPRLASHVPEEHRIADLTCEDEGECWTIQRQVLRHLAEQTNLTKLDFSVHMGSMKYLPQWYSLEMTQNSGLEELEKLTKLEYLYISNLNHSMGPQDLQWVEDMWDESQFKFRRY